MHLRLSLLMFLIYGVMGCWVPLFTVHLDELGFNPQEIALASATAALAYLAAPLAAGQLADRWMAAERCIAGGSLIAGLLLWILADLEEPAAVFWISLAYYVVMVPVLTISNALTFTHLADRAHQFGKIRLWGTIGWVVSAWLMGGWLGFGRQKWCRDFCTDWGIVAAVPALADMFRIGAVFAFATAAYALTLPHTPPKRRGQNWLAPLQALQMVRQRDFAVYLAGSMVLYLTLPFSSQMTPLLLKSLGIAEANLAPLLTISQAVEVVLLFLLPAILVRVGVRGTMLCGLATWGLGLTIFTLGEPVWLVVAALTSGGVCVACFMVAGQVFLNSRAAGHIRASAQSLLVFANGLGLLGGNLLVGKVRDWTAPVFWPTFLTAAGMAFALVLFFLIGFPRRQVPYQEPAEKVQ